ncbi:MAG TPA: calcium/sodium antiporter [Candidatus Latescibacteria bacterium]|nr:calcium/sodium antiporter [Candidatus Latescibacterota bacterium]
MGIGLPFLVFSGALALLLKSAGWFVEGAVGLAERFKVSKTAVGVVLVGLATTSAELAVSVQAAWLGHPEIALGNGVGSVVADDGLVLAVGVLLARSVAVDRRVLRSVGPFLLGGFGLSFLFAWNSHISRLEGLVLVLLLVGYYAYMVRAGRKGKLGAPVDVEVPMALSKVLLLFSGGAAGVLVSSYLVIESGLKIAKLLGTPEVVIGLTMIALGTSLPELSTAIAAARKGHAEVSVGNILGADVLNILLIIGSAALVNPITVEPETIRFSYPWAFFVVTTMLVLMRHKYRLNRAKAVLLLLLYGTFISLSLKLTG